MEWNNEAKKIIIEYVREYGINKTSRLLKCPRSTIGVIAKGHSVLPANKDIYSLELRKTIALQAIESANIRRVAITSGIARSNIQNWIKKYFTEDEVEKYQDITKSRIVGCHIAGKTATEISNEFNIPRRTVRNWIELYSEGKLEHVHHWIVESPNGPFSVATCKYCEDQTVMKNSIEGVTHWTQGRDRKTQDQELAEILATAKKQLIV